MPISRGRIEIRKFVEDNIYNDKDDIESFMKNIREGPESREITLDKMKAMNKDKLMEIGLSDEQADEFIQFNNAMNLGGATNRRMAVTDTMRTIRDITDASALHERVGNLAGGGKKSKRKKKKSTKMKKKKSIKRKKRKSTKRKKTKRK